MTSQYSSTLTYKYTSQVEMERLFSESGIEYRRDDFIDDTDSYSDVLEEIIDQASWECKAILNKLFTDTSLYQNVWIRRRATIIGCYLFSIRRGNDSQYFNEYIDALDDLRALVAGEIFLEGLTMGNATRPGMFNVSTDNRVPAMPIRVDWLTSTDTQGVKFIQLYKPYYWV